MNIVKGTGCEGDRADLPERRTEVRRRALKGAILSFNRGFSSFECVVRNLSDGGARLSVGETFALPSRFSLKLDGEAPRTAHVRWRTHNAIGIRFSAG
ncbi:PilZ domain-containing protein [Arvimicrobium flavum]|uniref:PilZ domain-containing protein n=1 Tax=Arvimicrobium flavum TaxID=3393320 RepID=UPI00237C0647|nr:PilZ domain-containing protein [Mesorhizobium shangrilense]